MRILWDSIGTISGFSIFGKPAYYGSLTKDPYCSSKRPTTPALKAKGIQFINRLICTLLGGPF